MKIFNKLFNKSKVEETKIEENKGEKIMNTKLQELKDLIKAKAEYQIKLKQNRKTVNFTGERLKYTYTYRIWDGKERKYVDEERAMHPFTAAELIGGTYRPNGDRYYCFGNPGTKHELRLLYAAYGLLRGKSFSQTENHYSEEDHPLNKYKDEIMQIVHEYEGEETVRVD